MMDKINPRLIDAFAKALKTIGVFIGICFVLFVWITVLIWTFQASLIIGTIVLLAFCVFIVTIYHYYNPYG